MRNFTLAIGLCLLSSAAMAASETEELRVLNPLEVADSMDKSGNPAAAVEILQARIAEEDATPDDFFKLSDSLQNLGAYDNSIQVMEKAHQKFPEDTKVLYQLGRAYINADRTRDAVHIMDMLIAMEPDKGTGYSAKGVAFDRAGNHFAAQEIYAMGLRVDPQSLALQNNMAMSFILDGRSKEAIDILEHLNKQYADQPKIRHNLALAYGLTGQGKKAMELGLQDLTEQQARENLKFYAHYSTLQKTHKSASLLSKSERIRVDRNESEPLRVVEPAPKTMVKEEEHKVSSADASAPAPEKKNEQSVPKEENKEDVSAPAEDSVNPESSDGAAMPEEKTTEPEQKEEIKAPAAPEAAPEEKPESKAEPEDKKVTIEELSPSAGSSEQAQEQSDDDDSFFDAEAEFRYPLQNSRIHK